MKKWTNVMLAICVSTVLAVTGCGSTAGNSKSSSNGSSASSNPSTGSGKKIQIKLSHHLSDKSGFQDAFDKFAQLAMKEDPELDIKIYPNSQLGSEKDAINQVKSGNLEMALGDMANFATFEKQLPVIDLPFLFSTYDEYHKVVDGPIGQKLSQMLLDKSGIKTLAYMDGGLRDIYTTKPVAKADDLKGLKIRVPEAAIYTDTFKALGTNPTSVPAAQMYTSLQTGVVNGMEGTSETAFTFKIGEVAKYGYETHHINQDAILIINDKFFKGLPDKAQQAILHAAKEAEKYQRDSWQKVEGDFKEKLKQMGVQFKQADLAPLQSSVKAVYDKFVSDTGAGDLLQQVQNGKK